MELVGCERAVPLHDPLTRHLAVFGTQLRAALAGSTPPVPAPIARRLELLAVLVDAFPQGREH